MKMPYTKKAEVTSCSHSQGRPISRVMMSHNTEKLKPNSVAPHSNISTASSQSSERHLSCRCRESTSDRSSAILNAPPVVVSTTALLHRRDQLMDLVGMRPQLLGHLVEVGRGDLGEARLVDVGHDLHAHALELGCRLVLEVESLRRFLLGDLVG